MKSVVFIILVLFGWGITNAQSYQVSGSVLDFHDKEPLKNATIKLGNLTEYSDENGNFSFNLIQKGSYLLTAEHPDCELFSEQLTVDRDLHLTIRLEHHVADIESVTIHAIHKTNNSLIVKTLDQKSLQQNSAENLGNLLTNIAGVGALKTGNNIAKPIIHGLYGSRIAIINNGVKMAEQEWGAEHAPNIDANQFEHIDVVKGASALKYGSDAIGGVVLLIPETFKKTDTLRGSANIAGISNGRGASFDMRIVKTWENNWALKTSGGYRKLGDLHTPEYNLMNTGLDFKSFGFTLQNENFLRGISLSYSSTNQEIGIFRGSHIGNLDDFYKALHTEEPLYRRDFSYEIDNPKQDIEHHIAKISAYKRFENWGKISADYSFQFNHRKEFDLRRGDLSQIPSLDLELFTNQFKINQLVERGNRSIESGLDLEYQYNYSTPATLARRLVPNYTKLSAGLYSVFKYKFSPKFNVEGGLRYDRNRYDVKKWYDESDWVNRYAAQYPQFYVKTQGNRVFTTPVLNFDNLSFNVGLQWVPSGKWQLKFNYAKIGRTPNVAELFADGLHHSAAVLEVGDMRLKNENGDQFNLHLEGNVAVMQGLQFSVNPYLFLTKNFINQVPTSVQNTIRGVFPVWSYEEIAVQMYGIDVDATLKFNKNWTYNGRFSYVNGTDITHDQPLILMLPPDFVNSLQFEKANWRNFVFRLENQTVLRQKNYPDYNPVIRIFENGEEVQKTLNLSTPPPSYTLWNLQTGIDFLPNFSVGLKVTNIFDRSYRDYLNRLRYFSAEMGRNFVLNIRYNF